MTAIKAGDMVIVFGKREATVTTVHKGGKRLGVVYADGKETFVTGHNAKAVAA